MSPKLRNLALGVVLVLATSIARLAVLTDVGFTILGQAPYVLWLSLFWVVKGKGVYLIPLGVMLALDAYSMIQVLWFPGNSTDAIAIAFLPALIGGVVLPATWLVTWALTRPKAAR
ncbi:MAG TPA: hypothetical protein VEJ63_18165 [Planctomycetota bacterium]|nr:hypothetical protein [Planctomycetota bacterium]